MQQSEIAQFEAAHGVRLPSDLRTYFETINGTGEDMDTNLFRFWPLAEVRLVEHVLSDTHPHQHAFHNCYVFADYSINCWNYAVQITGESEQSGPVFRVNGGSPPGEQVAGSFREFMELYLQDADTVL